MKAVLSILAVLSIVAVTACGETSRGKSGPVSPMPASARLPAIVVPVREGMLLVQEESQSTPPVFSISAGGAVQERPASWSYQMSPDKQEAAFVAQSIGGFTGIGLLGREGTRFFETGDWLYGHGAANPWLAWSRDGSRLAYTLPDESEPGKAQVYTVDRDGSGKRQITSIPDAYSVAGWTPGDEVLVRGSRELALLGEKSRALAPPLEMQAIGELTISPDGLKAAIQGSPDEQGLELWVLDLVTGESQLLAEMSGAVQTTGNDLYVSAGLPPLKPVARGGNLLLKGPGPVSWSPDSSRIAYFRSYTDTDNEFTSDLHIVNVATGEDTLLATRSWRTPEWSLDGRYLAFVRADATLAVARSDGIITELGLAATGATWSRSGSLIVPASTGVTLVDVESGATRRVSSGDGKPVWGEAAAGTWSPSGRYLAFPKPGDPGRHNGLLYVLDVNSAAATIAVDKGSYYPLAWLAGP